MPSRESHLNLRFKVKERYGTGGGASLIPSMSDKSTIRTRLRASRRLLPAWRQRLAAQTLMRRVAASVPGLKHARHVAFYLAADGEIDLTPLLRRCLDAGMSCYLPVLDRNGRNRLDFAPYHEKRPLQANRYGIPEPMTTRPELRSCRDMDVIFLPLVGFDQEGRRLGMGGGFYDRTLADCGNGRQADPLLVAVAHDIQYISRLPDEPWDIRPHMIVTPTRLIKRNT